MRVKDLGFRVFGRALGSAGFKRLRVKARTRLRVHRCQAVHIVGASAVYIYIYSLYIYIYIYYIEPLVENTAMQRCLLLKVGMGGAWLRALLPETNEGAPEVRVATHSCKATLFSWLAKRGVAAGPRRMLGYHVPRKDKSLVIYARDSLAAPLRELDKTIGEIAAGAFKPDLTRSGMVANLANPGDQTELFARVWLVFLCYFACRSVLYRPYIGFDIKTMTALYSPKAPRYYRGPRIY